VGAMFRDAKVTIFNNPVYVEGQVYFDLFKHKEVHWPGGTAAIELVYEVPANAGNLDLVRGLRVPTAASTASESSPRRANRVGTEVPSTNKSRVALLPPFKEKLEGGNPVRIRNPNSFAVEVGIRAGEKGRDFDVAANGVETVYMPNGRYEIYFVYSDKPDALFQGDSFALNDNGVEIQIVKVVNGNYDIRRVK